jgi:hypothetical protein
MVNLAGILRGQHLWLDWDSVVWTIETVHLFIRFTRVMRRN